MNLYAIYRKNWHEKISSEISLFLDTFYGFHYICILLVIKKFFFLKHLRENKIKEDFMLITVKSNSIDHSLPHLQKNFPVIPHLVLFKNKKGDGKAVPT